VRYGRYEGETRGVNGIRRFWARLGIAFVAGVTLLACDTPDSGTAPASPITAVQVVGNLGAAGVRGPATTVTGWGGEPTRVWGAEVRRRLAAG
jgi:hypothetical protein